MMNAKPQTLPDNGEPKAPSNNWRWVRLGDHVSKVGSGFTEKTLSALFKKFQPLRVAKCPFANLPTPRTRSAGLTAGEMKKCTWLEPKLVCQVRFTEWTRDDCLRAPVFLGLREDKDAREVVREKAA